MVGNGKAFFPRRLSRDPRLRLRPAHAPMRDQPIYLYGGRAVHDDYRVELSLLPGLDQQRDVMDDDGIVSRVGLDLSGSCPHPRVDDRLQPLARDSVIEDPSPHGGAVQTTLCIHNVGSEGDQDFRQPRRSRGHHLAGKQVGVDDDSPALGQNGADAGLTRADPTSQSNPEHLGHPAIPAQRVQRRDFTSEPRCR